MTSVAVGLAALVVPLLVLVVEAAGRRGLDAPTEVLWRMTGLRGVVFFVYWALCLEMAGYVLVHRMVEWKSGAAAGGLVVLAVTLVRLAVATNRVISLAEPGVIKERWLGMVREQARDLVKEDVIRRMGNLILDEELTPKGIATDHGRGSSMVLGAEQVTSVTLPPDAPFRYVDDIDIGLIRDAAGRLMPGEDRAFSRVTFGIALGHIAIISDGITMVHRPDAAPAAQQLSSQFRQALRLGPSRLDRLREAIDFILSSALEALGRSDSAHAATLIEDFSSVLVESAAKFNSLPPETQKLPRKRNDRLQLLEWTAAAMDALVAGAGIGPLPSLTVDDAILAVWRRGWALAVAASDLLGATYLAQVVAGLERLIHGLPADRQRRFREWVAAGGWGAIRWYEISVEGNGQREIGVDRFEAFGAVAVTTMVNQLRQAIRNTDLEGFKQILAANQQEELELRGELSMRRRALWRPGPLAQDDMDEETIAKALERAGADQYDHFRIGVGKAVSWTFRMTLGGHVPATFAHSALEQAKNVLTPDVDHLVRVLRHSMGELVLPGERDTDWMWTVPSGVFSIGGDLGEPLWAFVLAYVLTPPAAAMLLPELDGVVIESNPEQLLGAYLQEAEARADVVAACLNDGLTPDLVRERLARLRQETTRWKQQLSTMRLSRVATQPLDQTLVAGAKKRTEDQYDRHDILGRMLKEAGREAWIIGSCVRPYQNDRQLHPREEFILGGSGATRVAELFGEMLAHSESSVIALAAIEKQQDVRRADWHGFDAAVEEALSDLDGAEYSPSVIFIGDQAARTAMKMQPRSRSGVSDRYLLGTKHDALVIVAADLPPGIAVVVDLVRAGHSELHLQTQGDHPIRSTIEDLSDEQIAGLLAAHPNLHKGDDGRDLTEAEAKLSLRSNVWWRVRLHVGFDVEDVNAIRVIQMDPVPSDAQLADIWTRNIVQ